MDYLPEILSRLMVTTAFPNFNDSFEVIVTDRNSFIIDATFLDNSCHQRELADWPPLWAQ